MDHDVRIGDVWRSATGRNIVRVEKIEPYMPGSEWSEVHWRRLTKDYTPAGQGGKCGLHNFTRGRTLVERGGVRVGDVRSCAGYRCRVDHFDPTIPDWVIVDGTSGRESLPTDAVAAMELVERAGKAV